MKAYSCLILISAPITATDCQAEQHGIQGKEGKITCIASAQGTSTVISFERDGEPLSNADGCKSCII